MTDTIPTPPSTSKSDSIEWFIEAQAFSRSYDIIPRPSPPPYSPVSKLDRRHTGRLLDNLLTGEGGGEEGGRGAESYDRKKAWSSINHSILSAQSVKKTFPGEVEGEGDTGGGGEGARGEGALGGGALTGPPTQTHTGRKKQSDTRLHLLHHPPTNYVVPPAVIWIFPRLNGRQYVLIYSGCRLWQIIWRFSSYERGLFNVFFLEQLWFSCKFYL